MEYEYKGGINFFELLSLMLVGFKITGYIDWSWIMVFSPIIIEISVVGALGLITVLLDYYYGEKEDKDE